MSQNSDSSDDCDKELFNYEGKEKLVFKYNLTDTQDCRFFPIHNICDSSDDEESPLKRPRTSSPVFFSEASQQLPVNDGVLVLDTQDPSADSSSAFLDSDVVVSETDAENSETQENNGDRKLEKSEVAELDLLGNRKIFIHSNK